MAYEAVVDVQTRWVNGRRHFIVTVEETEAAQADEAIIEGLPSLGTIKLFRSTLTDGTGTTIHPGLGRSPGWAAATQDEVAQVQDAAAHVAEVSEAPYYSADGKLYLHSTPNSEEADHVISTEIIILEGVGVSEGVD